MSEPDDLLGTVKAALAIVPELHIDDWSMAYTDGLRTSRVTGRMLRALVDRCEQAEADLAALRHELRDCPTCGGSGVMSVLVAVHPPDEREEYAETQCAECGGRGMSCYARLEADRDAIVAALTDVLRMAKAKAEQYQIDWMAAKAEFGDKIAALRQRHELAVLMAWHEGAKWGEAHPLSLCTDRNAAWQVSEAKKGLDAWARREP